MKLGESSRVAKVSAPSGDECPAAILTNYRMVDESHDGGLGSFPGSCSGVEKQEYVRRIGGKRIKRRR